MTVPPLSLSNVLNPREKEPPKLTKGMVAFIEKINDPNNPVVKRILEGISWNEKTKTSLNQYLKGIRCARDPNHDFAGINNLFKNPQNESEYVCRACRDIILFHSLSERDRFLQEFIKKINNPNDSVVKRVQEKGLSWNAHIKTSLNQYAKGLRCAKDPNHDYAGIDYLVKNPEKKSEYICFPCHRKMQNHSSEKKEEFIQAFLSKINNPEDPVVKRVLTKNIRTWNGPTKNSLNQYAKGLRCAKDPNHDYAGLSPLRHNPLNISEYLCNDCWKSV